MKFCHKLARKSLKFRLTHLVDIHSNAALGTSKRNVDHRCFPGHEGSERTDFIEIDLWVVAEPTFHWTPRVVVLNPIAGKCR